MYPLSIFPSNTQMNGGNVGINARPEIRMFSSLQLPYSYKRKIILEDNILRKIGKAVNCIFKERYLHPLHSCIVLITLVSFYTDHKFLWVQ